MEVSTSFFVDRYSIPRLYEPRRTSSRSFNGFSRETELFMRSEVNLTMSNRQYTESACNRQTAKAAAKPNLTTNDPPIAEVDEVRSRPASGLSDWSIVTIIYIAKSKVRIRELAD